MGVFCGTVATCHLHACLGKLVSSSSSVCVCVYSLIHIDWAGYGFDDALRILVSIFLDTFLIPTIPKLHFLSPFRSFEMHMPYGNQISCIWKQIDC